MPAKQINKIKVIILPAEPEQEEYSNWTDEEWQDFSLRSFMNTQDDKDVDWDKFLGVEKANQT